MNDVSGGDVSGEVDVGSTDSVSSSTPAEVTV
jgi:hypothetical protein